MASVSDVKLDEAAELLMQQLPAGANELLRVLSLDNKVSIWWCVCGVLMEAYIGGRLSAMTFDPDWHREFKQPSNVCAMCNKQFDPTQIGQVYCSNNCGNAAGLMESLKFYEEQRASEVERLDAIKARYPKSMHDQIYMAGLVDLDRMIEDTKQEINRLVGNVPTEEKGGNIKAGNDDPVVGPVADKLSAAGDGKHTDVTAAKVAERKSDTPEPKKGEDRIKELRDRSVQAKGKSK